MASERKVVWFNSDTEKDEYELAQSMQFSTEVKRWLRQRVERRKSLVSQVESDLSKRGSDSK